MTLRNRRSKLGAALAFAGVALTTVDGWSGAADPVGIGLTLAGCAAWGLYAVLAAPLIAKHGSSGVAGSILAIGVVGGTSGNPCITPKSVSKGCWRVTHAITTAPLAYNTFRQNLQPTGGIPENPFDYARVVFDPQGTPWLFGNLQVPVGGIVAGYAPSETTLGVGYVPWLP